MCDGFESGWVDEQNSPYYIIENSLFATTLGPWRISALNHSDKEFWNRDGVSPMTVIFCQVKRKRKSRLEGKYASSRKMEFLASDLETIGWLYKKKHEKLKGKRNTSIQYPISLGSLALHWFLKFLNVLRANYVSCCSLICDSKTFTRNFVWFNNIVKHWYS